MAMVEEDTPPQQAPTLTEVESARADVATARQIDLEWLMASGGSSDAVGLLAEIVNRPAWHRQAACRGMGPDAFFVTRGESTDNAKAICERCAVHAECLDASLAEPRTMGVWAGLSERGRRQMRRSVA
jgi:WhiB family redox-sensing transcriptional regulator